MEQTITAAQYLRMSTEHQQYSFENQERAISNYAEQHGFRIIKTYSDPGKSGLVLRYRQGLLNLLSDVVSGRSEYKAILVFDVSRWGRFQDVDEAAHYEFLCKSAGVPIHYCAEPFQNDCSLPATIFKALKRTMAGEFSRDLSARVYQGQKTISHKGFRIGGSAGFGYRRQVVSADGKRRQILQKGEHKGVATDRTTLVFGPAREVKATRQIFEMVLRGKRPMQIVHWLNENKIRRDYGNLPWTIQAVLGILRNPKYKGVLIWGRAAQKLSGQRVKNPREDWIVIPRAFPAIVSEHTFDRAQQILHDQQIPLPPEEILRRIREAWKRKGALSASIIRNTSAIPDPSTIYRHIGTLREVYRQIGFVPKPIVYLRKGRVEKSRRMRERVLAEIVALYPDNVSVYRPPGKQRKIVLFDDRVPLSIYACIKYKTELAKPGWIIDAPPDERKNVSLLCLMDDEQQSFEAYYLMPPGFRFCERTKLRLELPKFRRAIRLNSLSEVRSEACRLWVNSSH